MLAGNFILTLDETTLILTRRHVLKQNVAWQRSKQRDPAANKHRHASDNQSLNQPCPQESLNGDSPVDVHVAYAARLELGDDRGGFTRHALNHRSSRGRRQWPRTQDEHGLRTIGPAAKAQHRLKRVPPDNQRIHTGNEFFVAVGFAAARLKEIERTVLTCDEAIEASADEYGGLHAVVPCCRLTDRASLPPHAQQAGGCPARRIRDSRPEAAPRGGRVARPMPAQTGGAPRPAPPPPPSPRRTARRRDSSGRSSQVSCGTYAKVYGHRTDRASAAGDSLAGAREADARPRPPGRKHCASLKGSPPASVLPRGGTHHPLQVLPACGLRRRPVSAWLDGITYLIS